MRNKSPICRLNGSRVGGNSRHIPNVLTERIKCHTEQPTHAQFVGCSSVTPNLQHTPPKKTRQRPVSFYRSLARLYYIRLCTERLAY